MPKYRKPVLKGAVKEFVEETVKTIAEAKEFKILELRVMPDHILCKCPATVFPPGDSQEELGGGHLWSSSYYVGTAGHVSAETIQKYIEGNLNSSTV